MANENKAEMVAALFERLFGEEAVQRLGRWGPVLDISRENFHDSKSEFLREYEVTKAVHELSEKIIETLIGEDSEKDANHNLMIHRLREAVDKIARKDSLSLSNDDAKKLILRNVVDYGFFDNTLSVLIMITISFSKRLDDLDRQRDEFWNLSHRAPNYYARTIALRFARVFARERGAKPTFGTARDGGYPSTEFGRALEELFGVLGIKANVRKAAEWAISQLKDSDWSQNALLMGRSGLPKDKAPRTFSIIEALASMDKDRKK